MKRFIFSGLLLPLMFAACRPDRAEVSPQLPPTPDLTAELRWGVVNQSYIRIMDSPEMSSAVLGLLRSGDITEITARVDTESGYWLEIYFPETGAGGWVPDDYMDIFDSAAQARTARDRLIPLADF